MTIIKGKVDYNKSISTWLAARASDTIKKFIQQSECEHDGDIILDEYIHPHNGDEMSARQCVKCGKIL